MMSLYMTILRRKHKKARSQRSVCACGHFHLSGNALTCLTCGRPTPRADESIEWKQCRNCGHRHPAEDLSANRLCVDCLKEMEAAVLGRGDGRHGANDRKAAQAE